MTATHLLVCVYFILNVNMVAVTPYEFVYNFNENVNWDTLHTFLFKPQI